MIGRDYPTVSDDELDPDAPPVRCLADAHAVFRRWLGDDYDLGSLDAVLAAAAVEQLDGDPVWLLVLSGAGNAKTETVGALEGAGAHVESTIKSEGALLSATPARERAKGATGGLLRKIGTRGVVVLKDFTTILSMNRDQRAEVLAALREVYDGHWSRNVGSDGGHSLTWSGRIVLIGATTSAYDAAHSVIAAMGDRFALIRTDSGTGRRTAGRQSLRNVGSESQMRSDLRAAAGAVLGRLDPDAAVLDEDATERLLLAADLVTHARTAVERDYQGNVLDAHAPEMPTRFAKMLGQIMRGCLAIGATREHAMNTALRVAADSTPPMRLAILRDLAGAPNRNLADVTRSLQKPKSTVKRELDALHLIGLLHYDEVEYTKWNNEPGMSWVYRLADGVDVSVLDRVLVPEMSVHAPSTPKNATPDEAPLNAGTDKSGPKPSYLVPVCTDCGYPVDTDDHGAACEVP